MTTMTFDTLHFAQRLKKGGFSESQSEAIAEAMRDAQLDSADELRAMTPGYSRDAESVLLTRCAVVARGLAVLPEDSREANVFRLAAMVVKSRFPDESKSLLEASERYFALHPDEKLSPEDVIGKGWIINPPRLRDMLSHRLQSP